MAAAQEPIEKAEAMLLELAKPTVVARPLGAPAPTTCWCLRAGVDDPPAPCAVAHSRIGHEGRRGASVKLEPWIQVDGGQNGANAWRAVEAGADAIVAGTAIFGASDCAAAIAGLRPATPPVA